MSSDTKEFLAQIRQLTNERDTLTLMVEELGVALEARGGKFPAHVSSDEEQAGDGVFDASWYLETYSDVSMLGMDPKEHFDWIGRRLGRAPNAKAVKKKKGAHAGFWQIHR